MPKVCAPCSIHVDLDNQGWAMFKEVLRIIKESADWHPALKAALGGTYALAEAYDVWKNLIPWSIAH